MKNESSIGECNRGLRGMSFTLFFPGVLGIDPGEGHDSGEGMWSRFRVELCSMVGLKLSVLLGDVKLGDGGSGARNVLLYTSVDLILGRVDLTMVRSSFLSNTRCRSVLLDTSHSAHCPLFPLLG